MPQSEPLYRQLIASMSLTLRIIEQATQENLILATDSTFRNQHCLNEMGISTLKTRF